MRTLAFVNLTFLMKSLITGLRVLMSKEEQAAVRACDSIRDLEGTTALRRGSLGGSPTLRAQFQ